MLSCSALVRSTPPRQQSSTDPFGRLDRVCAFRVCMLGHSCDLLLTDHLHSVLSVKGNKVLHIDRNDHYGAYVAATC